MIDSIPRPTPRPTHRRTESVRSGLRGSRPSVSLLLPCLTAGALLGGCQRPGDDGEARLDRTVAKRELPRVETEPVARREMVSSFETTTTVVSEAEVTLFPRSAGVVVEVLAEEGDRVRAGEVLARLDDREARNALMDAEVALEEALDAVPRLALATAEAKSRRDTAEQAWTQAKRDHERNEAIAAGDDDDKPGLISMKDLDASRLARDQARGDFEASVVAFQRAELEEAAGQTAVTRARLARDRAALTLSFTEIVAPFDGVVATRTIKIGDTVTSASPAFVLSNTDELHAVIARAQRELPLFRQQDDAGSAPIEITAWPDAIPGRSYRGEILRIAPTIDGESGNFRVTIRLDPGEETGADRLLPGMFVRLEIVTDRHPDALVVPKRAVRRQGDESVLFRVVDGRAERLRVEELYADDEWVEVRPLARSLAVGDRVIVVGTRDLEDGAAVDDVSAASSAPPEDGSAEPDETPVAAPGTDAEAANG